MASALRQAASDRSRDGARDADQHGDASVLRPSNDPRHANRCETNETTGALQSCSCKTVKLLMVSSAPTQTQQLLRRACGSLRQIKYSRCSQPNSSMVQYVSGFLLAV